MEYQVNQVRLEKGATRGPRECPEKTAGKAILEQLDLGEPLALLERWVPRVPREPRDILVLRATVVQEEHREDRVRWGRSVRGETRDLPDQRVPPDPEASRG